MATPRDAAVRAHDARAAPLPALGGERPSKRQDIVDAAMEMADRLVHTQYDFIRGVVQSAGKALGKADEGKKSDAGTDNGQ